MSAEYPELEHLIAVLKSRQRSVLARKLSRDLRAETSKDILKNIDADGKPMTSRKRQKNRKAKTGRMFKKLGLRKSMRMRSNSQLSDFSA